MGHYGLSDFGACCCWRCVGPPRGVGSIDPAGDERRRMLDEPVSAVDAQDCAEGPLVAIKARHYHVVPPIRRIPLRGWGRGRRAAGDASAALF